MLSDENISYVFWFSIWLKTKISRERSRKNLKNLIFRNVVYKNTVGK